jgi:hypothetical protein
MENLRGFCHYPHRGVDAGRNSYYRVKEYVQLPSPPFKCNVLRERLSMEYGQSKYALRSTKEKGVVASECEEAFFALIHLRLYTSTQNKPKNLPLKDNWCLFVSKLTSGFYELLFYGVRLWCRPP